MSNWNYNTSWLIIMHPEQSEYSSHLNPSDLCFSWLRLLKQITKKLSAITQRRRKCMQLFWLNPVHCLWAVNTPQSVLKYHTTKENNSCNSTEMTLAAIFIHKFFVLYFFFTGNTFFSEWLVQNSFTAV